MARYQTTFTTKTPIADAFAFLSRFSTTAEWDPGVIEARDLTPGPVGLGSQFEVVSTFLGRRVPLRYEIIEFAPPALVTLRGENGNVRSTDTIRFVANEDGTVTITYDAELEPLGLLRLFGPILSLSFRVIGDRATVGLKHAVDRLGHHEASKSPTSGMDR